MRSKCVYVGFGWRRQLLGSASHVGRSRDPRASDPRRRRDSRRPVAEATPVLQQAASLKREDYAHVDTRKSLLSICYIPLLRGEDLIGALEILAFEEEISQEAVEALLPAANVAGVAISTAKAYEDERNGTLNSITRLTQLYDLEKVFSSTLEMDELLPLIATKFSEILACQAVNIWLLLADETVELMHQAGTDPTVFKGKIKNPNEGIAGAISDNGETLCHIRSAGRKAGAAQSSFAGNGSLFLDCRADHG